MNLLDYARIATSKMALANREDLMQDAIEYILAKNLQERENAYIIRSIKNCILEEMRKARRKKRYGSYEHTTSFDIPSYDKYQLFDFFGDVNPRHLMVALMVVNDGYENTKAATGFSTRRLQTIFYHVKKQVTKQSEKL